MDKHPQKSIKMKPSKCLICYKPSLDEWSRSKRTSSSTNCKNPVKEKVTDQVRVVFILRKLLQIPSSLCQKFLSEVGNPASWISTCSHCTILVDEAWFILTQIHQLQRKLDTLGYNVRSEVKESVSVLNSKAMSRSKTLRDDDKALRVTNKAREFVAEALGSFIEEPDGLEGTYQETDDFPGPQPRIIDVRTVPAEKFQKDTVDDKQAIVNDTLKHVPILAQNPPTSVKRRRGELRRSPVNGQNDLGHLHPPSQETFIHERKLPSKRQGTVVNYCELALGLKGIELDISEDPLRLESKADGGRGTQDSEDAWSTYSIKEETLNDEDDGDFELDGNTAESDEETEYYSTGGAKKKLPLSKGNTSKLPDVEVTKIASKTKSSNEKLEKQKSNPVGCPNTVICDICDWDYADKEKLRLHRLKMHNIPAVYDRQADIRKAEQEGTIISEGAASDETDKSPTPDDGKEYDSNCSNLSFEDPMSKPERRKRHTKVRHTHCDVCDKKYPGYKDLMKHRKEYHNLVPWGVLSKDVNTCEYCGRHYTIHDSLRKHMLKVHGIRERPYKRKPKRDETYPWQCHTCMKKYKTYEDRALHEKKEHNKVHKDGQFKCVICMKSYDVKTDLIVHYDVDHKPDPPEPNLPKEPNKSVGGSLQCKLCTHGGRRYETDAKLQIHIRKIHEGDKVPFKCEVCGKGWHSPGALRKHMQVPTGERLFPCDFPGCSETFTCSVYVTFHKLRVHDAKGKDLLRCNICMKTFSTPTFLKIHKKSVHEKIYKYTCEICGMGCQHISNYRNHMKLHEERSSGVVILREKPGPKPKRGLVTVTKTVVNSSAPSDVPLTLANIQTNDSESEPVAESDNPLLLAEQIFQSINL